jgi:uridine monophosphate synthetase
MEDFDSDVIRQLIKYKEQYGFAIWEDRKFADIGSIVHRQIHEGMYKISSWADYVSVHVISGPGILDELNDLGAIVIVNMSTKDNIMDDTYMQNALNIINANTNVVGIVSQIKHNSVNIPHIVPGINITSNADSSDQIYNSFELKKWADLFVVGRGIIMTANIAEVCREYVEHINILLK